jgi:hypothetical protein
MTRQSNLGTAVVTGVTGSVGSSYALGLAERGYDLLLVGRLEATLRTVADGIVKATGRDARIATCDLSDAAQVDDLSEGLRNQANISLLANIAGYSAFRPFTQITSAEIDKTIAVNTSAPTHLCRAVAPGFAERRRGTIVNFASVLAFHPWAEFNVYNGAKAFVVMFSQSLQAELRDKGVLVQIVAPTATATSFWKEAGFPYENFPAGAVMRPEDLVKAALVGLDKQEEWVLPSLSDLSPWEAFDADRTNLVKRMMNGTLAGRYVNA